MKKSVSLPNINKINSFSLKRNVSTNALDSIASEAILLNNASIPQIITCLSSNRSKSLDEDLAICLITPPEIFEDKKILKEEPKPRRIRRKDYEK